MRYRLTVHVGHLIVLCGGNVLEWIGGVLLFSWGG